MTVAATLLLPVFLCPPMVECFAFPGPVDAGVPALEAPSDVTPVFAKLVDTGVGAAVCEGVFCAEVFISES